MARAYISEFVESNGIQKGDVVWVEQLAIGLKDRSVVYVGKDSYSAPLFAVDTYEGYRYLHSWELPTFLGEMRPQKIKRFQGTEAEREMVVRAVRTNLNEDTFNLALNWCEPDRPKLSQANTSGLDNAGGIALAGLALLLLLALFKDDK